jgi:hypothetical protein
MLWSLIGGILGGSLLAFTPEDNRAAKMAGNYLTHVVGAFLPCCYSFAAANQGGHTKKVTMNAILLMSFCLVSETNEKKDNLADDFRNHLMLEIENDC